MRGSARPTPCVRCLGPTRARTDSTQRPRHHQLASSATTSHAPACPNSCRRYNPHHVSPEQAGRALGGHLAHERERDHDLRRSTTKPARKIIHAGRSPTWSGRTGATVYERHERHESGRRRAKQREQGPLEHPPTAPTRRAPRGPPLERDRRTAARPPRKTASSESAIPGISRCSDSPHRYRSRSGPAR